MLQKKGNKNAKTAILINSTFMHFTAKNDRNLKNKNFEKYLLKFYQNFKNGKLKKSFF